MSTLDGHERHRRDYHYDALSRLEREVVKTVETEHPEQAWDVNNNPFWLNLQWQRSVRYDAHYGWVKQQYQGPLPGAYTFDAAAATYSHYWRRDRYGYVTEEGNVAFAGDPNGWGRLLVTQDAWGTPTQL